MNNRHPIRFRPGWLLCHRAGLVLAVLLTLAPLASLAQTLTVLNPRELRSSTSAEFVNILARTEAGASASVGGQAVPVYSSGVFVRDRVPLQMGVNRIEVEVKDTKGAVARQTLEVERTAPTPAPVPPSDRLWVEPGSVAPLVVHRVAEEEPVDVSLRGTPGQKAEMRHGEGAWQRMHEPEPGLYTGRLLLSGPADTEPLPVHIRLSWASATPSGAEPTLSVQSPGTVGLWKRSGWRLYATGPQGAALSHGVHTVRLGGPFLSELPPGVRLRVTGQQDQMLRVELAPNTTAWVPQQSLQALSSGSQRVRPVFTNVSAYETDGADVVMIPFPGTLPHAARLVEDAGHAAIEVDLFGTHEAATWITHAAKLRTIKEVRVQQVAAEHVRVRIALLHGVPWGWKVEAQPRSLRVMVRYSPPGVVPGSGRNALASSGTASGASALRGLVVALEAGHGSDANLGAVGATGVPEKDINRWTTDLLKAELTAAGATVIDIREGDSNPNLRERAERAQAADAHVYLSIHANAAETDRGYLRAGGTSNYYKHAHSRPLAAAIQTRMLAETGLPDFGLVGNFNYLPIRVLSWMPAVLVELAFMSNPAEEAQMLEPAFRQRMARAIRLGLEDFLTRPAAR